MASDEFSADDYREMVEEMDAEEARRACEEEGVHVAALATSEELRAALLAHYCGAGGGAAAAASLPPQWEEGADEGEFSADDYREMVEEMDAEEARRACGEEGVHVAALATLEEVRAALLAHYCGAGGGAAGAASLPPQWEEGADEGEFSADDYREMVEEMDAEEARRACGEEGVHVAALATLEEVRAALLAHYCGAGGGAAGAASLPLTLSIEIVVDEGEFSADDYREMVEEMDAEEARLACAEENVHVGALATLEEMRTALVAHHANPAHAISTPTSAGRQRVASGAELRAKAHLQETEAKLQQANARHEQRRHQREQRAQSPPTLAKQPDAAVGLGSDRCVRSPVQHTTRTRKHATA